MNTKIKNILNEILGYVIFTIVVAILMIGWRILDDYVCDMKYVWGVLMMSLIGLMIWMEEIRPYLRKRRIKKWKSNK